MLKIGLVDRLDEKGCIGRMHWMPLTETMKAFRKNKFQEERSRVVLEMLNLKHERCPIPD